jgi:predicted nucleotidyltransferase
MDLEALRPELQALFARRPVRLAYLFGSQTTGRTHSESDVDIAVLLDAALTLDERYAERLALIGDLMRVFATDDVDLVILNEAPPLLAFEVLRGGVLLYCPDDSERVEFQVRTLLEYEATEPLRRLLAEAMERRIREGSFGKPVRLRRGTAPRD